MAVKSHVGQVIVAMAPSDELVAISNEADITINPSSFHIFALITIFFSIFPKIDRITFAHFTCSASIFCQQINLGLMQRRNLMFTEIFCEVVSRLTETKTNSFFESHFDPNIETISV